MRILVLGDWVQAVGRVDDEGVEAARKGDVGHVVGAADSAGWATVLFERTGHATICAPSEIRFLGDADTGRFERRVSVGN